MRLSALLGAAQLRLPPGYRHGTWRPDTIAAQSRNPPGLRRRKIFVEPIAREDWKVFRGDTVSVPPPSPASHPLPVPRGPPLSPLPVPQVQVLVGKDAGKQAMVTQVVRARNWVVVEGLNTVRLVPAAGGLPWIGGDTHRGVSVTPPPLPATPQHYRYVNRTAKYAGTYIASEAPLLLSQISLVDPEDR